MKFMVLAILLMGQIGWADDTLPYAPDRVNTNYCTSQDVLENRKIPITPEMMKNQCNPLRLNPEESFWVAERDGRLRLVDPIISQKLK
ncbi:MAG: hypothetical protein M0P73_01360 [Syntrophobacterales bacterium]|jgi:hypothetical protein|nr:hypothetical protein [Syntrophobacterales bacterium]